MAIDRGPFNTLVDDDGSNLVGSIWNKNQIKTVLLDPIDTLIGPWVTIPHNPANYTSASGDAWYVPTAVQKYSVHGKTAQIVVAIQNSQNFIASYGLFVGGWPFTLKTILSGHDWAPGVTSYSAAGGFGPCLLAPSAANLIDLRRTNFSDWPVTGADLMVSFQGVFEIL
jgi:hypothetical protein